MEQIPQVRQALEVIKHVCSISSTVRANRTQCVFLANRFRAVGKGLDSGMGWNEIFHGRNAFRSTDSYRYPALDELLTVLRKGEALVLSYVDSGTIFSILLGRTDNRESFQEIHEELNTLKAQFNFESSSACGPVNEFEASSGVQRSEALNRDADQDLKNMPEDMAHLQDSEHAAQMDMRNVTHIVSEKSRGSGDELPSYLQVDLAAVEIGEPVREVVIKNKGVQKDRGWAVVRRGKYKGIEFAVKVFKSLGTDSTAWNDKQLLMEVGSLEKFRHPHIVKLVYFGRDSEKCGLLMELMDSDLRHYIEGRLKRKARSFKRVLMKLMDSGLRGCIKEWWERESRRPFSRSEELDIITQIAKGMHYMHNQKYVHGDLKCSNILVKKSGDHLDVKISDFRDSQKLGKVLDKEAVRQASVTRRPRYTPPEALKKYSGAEPSADLLRKADVYGFAMTSYEILTGKYPFDGIRDEKLLEQQIHAGQRPELPADVDEDMKGLIRECWDPDPGRRPEFVKICYLLDIIRSNKPFVVSNQSSCKVLALSVWNWIWKWVLGVFIIFAGLLWIAPEPEEQAGSNQSTEWGEMVGSEISRSKSVPSVPKQWQIPRRELKIVRRIEQGSSSTVYKATWLGCTFAVKDVTNPVSIATLQSEVDFLMTLSRHPFIAMMVGFCVDSDQRCSIVMEFMDGNLRDLIKLRMRKRRPWLLKGFVAPFELQESVSIISKIALGMEFLHFKGVMHLDLKSKNVLAEERPEGIDVKLVDFGLSMNEKENEGREGSWGTAFWRAPEVLRRDPYWKALDNALKLDLKSADVYSFAVTCYEVLTGNEPFEDLKPFDRSHQKLVIDGYRPALPARLHPRLKALIEKCWHGNPVERPKFTEICEELRKIQAALPRRSFSIL